MPSVQSHRAADGTSHFVVEGCSLTTENDMGTLERAPIYYTFNDSEGRSADNGGRVADKSAAAHPHIYGPRVADGCGNQAESTDVDRQDSMCLCDSCYTRRTGAVSYTHLTLPTKHPV